MTPLNLQIFTSQATMAQFGSRHRSRDYHAGFLTFEAEVKYPFHPLVGRTVVVVGDLVHDVFVIFARGSHKRPMRAAIPRIGAGAECVEIR